MKKMLIILAAVAALLTVSCTKDEGYNAFGGYSEKDSYDSPSGAYGGGLIGGNGGGGQAGVLTAAEWNDLANWSFWTGIMNGQEWNSSFEMWKFDTSARIAVRVKDAEENPVANVTVELMQGQSVLWTAKTSNVGEANLWHGLYPNDIEPATDLTLRIGGQDVGEPVISNGKEEQTPLWNEYTVSVAAPAAKADLAFIVDATGSMGDEIAFLKEDLLSILNRVQTSQSGVEIRTGTVFYRDEGDEYVTRYSAFTTDFAATMKYISGQYAAGGGDLPEAVHTALETTLQKLDWNPQARSRLAFLLLDAPAHYGQQGVVESLHQSIEAFARYGIRLIPVLASTGDKTTEFMCRYFAIVTGGTYVFLTDDSGVGESHLTPTVGQYTVEKLNDLLVRLINENI